MYQILIVIIIQNPGSLNNDNWMFRKRQASNALIVYSEVAIIPKHGILVFCSAILKKGYPQKVTLSGCRAHPPTMHGARDTPLSLGFLR